MLIKVKVHPETRKEETRKIKEDKFELFIRARAQNNEANTRVLEIMVEIFPENKGIKIVKGHTTPNKIIEVLE